MKFALNMQSKGETMKKRREIGDAIGKMPIPLPKFVTPVRRSESGISLVELMIAMTIIAIALFAILSMITQMMTMKEVAKENELAKEWVQKRIEEIKSQPIANLNNTVCLSGRTDTKGSASLGFPRQSTGLGSKYTAIYSTVNYALPFDEPCPPLELAAATGTVVIDYTNANLYEILASITWKARNGKTGVYTMRNLYSK
jgi:type II secretory pathway pseudopilin PulG